MICKAYYVANSINITTLPSNKKLREVCYIKTENNLYVVFPYGIVVAWGDGNIADALILMSAYLDNPTDQTKMIHDEFSIQFVDQKPEKLVFEDSIYLQSNDELELVALSHPIAQSLRLSIIEDSILESIKKIKHIPANLAEHGKIYESKNKISKMRGHLYLLKGQISFEHSVLDKPEYFWEYPEYDEYYNRIAEYLEISPRIVILREKMSTIDEILSILSDELNHRHSSTLEWIIIFLILIEVFFFFLKDIFKIIE